MKMTVDVECTRANQGNLLDCYLQPMQASLLTEIEKRTIAEIDKFSAENM
jgi:hypothetical protein